MQDSRFYVAEPSDGWVAVFPNLTPEIDRFPKTLSASLGCFLVSLVSADENDLYCMYFRDGSSSRGSRSRPAEAGRCDALV